MIIPKLTTMFKSFKNTAEKVVDSVSDAITGCGEQFLKTFDEIESEFRYYTHLYACEALKLYSSSFSSHKKMEIQPDDLAVTLILNDSVYMEENY